MVDIARSPEVKRKKKIRRIISPRSPSSRSSGSRMGVSRLQPAAPGVDRATVWIDTVKRGPMTRQVRGSGTLVPENIRWIPATTSGRVERLVLRPGAQVTPTTVILEMSNPDLQQQVMEAQLAFRSAQAALENRRADPPERPPDAGIGRRHGRIELQPGDADARGQRRALQGQADLRAAAEAVRGQRRRDEEPAEHRAEAARDRARRVSSRSSRRRKPTSTSARLPTSCACGSSTI